MKKTFSNFRTLAALLMAGAAFAACSSDDNIIENQQPAKPGEQVYTLTINASKDDGTTRALNLSGESLVASWTNGDELTVYNASKGEWLTGTLTASNASGSTATFSGALTGTIEVGNYLELHYHPIDFANFNNQDGTLKGTNGAEKYDKAFADVTVASVDGSGNITITESYANFHTQTAMLKLTLQDNAATPNKLNATSLKISVSGIGDLYTFSPTAATYTANGDGILYFAMPNAWDAAYMKGADEDAIKAATVTFTATVGGKIYTATKPGYKFLSGKYYAATLTMTPTGALAGKFTINGSGDKVYFSQGNLRYTSSAWSFFANQWDYYTTYSDGSLDKFGWSTSTTYGMSASTTGDYSGDFVDWGATIGSGWRTLTSDEWTYLFNTRSASTVNSTQNARYAKAYLFGTKHGVILFPDSYTHPDGVAAPTGINATNSTSWDANKYSAADWAKMEAAGCVFLPAAGNRNEASIYNAGSYGFYWSSSPHASNVSYAYSMYFVQGYLYPANDFYRYYGYSVRLVYDAN